MANRKPSWPLWCAAVLIGVPVLYVASFGPACWLVQREYLSVGAFRVIHRPALFLANYEWGKPVYDAMSWMASECNGDGGLALVRYIERLEFYRHWDPNDVP